MNADEHKRVEQEMKRIEEEKKREMGYRTSIVSRLENAKRQSHPIENEIKQNEDRLQRQDEKIGNLDKKISDLMSHL